VAVMLQPPSSNSAVQPNPCLAAALTHVPGTPQAEAACPSSVDPQQLLPSGAAAERFVHYSGSLTTPPCSEQVDWLVWQQPLPVTDKQVSAGTCPASNSVQRTPAVFMETSVLTRRMPASKAGVVSQQTGLCRPMGAQKR
jgi:carbonic anhydrase